LFNVKPITELVENSKKFTRNIKVREPLLHTKDESRNKNSGIKQGMSGTNINNY